ncbi:MAG: heme o synthase [Candidatus Korarchaeota archaeon]|nr:heme o synthase [Candidatus Korarchaeota archaeon]
MEARAVSKLSSRISDYVCLTKPKQTFLLLLTSVFTYIGAGGYRLDILTLLTAAMVLSISGTTAVNMALDADIDSMMGRTKQRPIPAGRVGRGEALSFGILLFLLGVAVAYLINVWTAFSTSLGVMFDLIVYTLWTKRRTPLSIVFGGVAGAAPSLAGWAAARGMLELPALLIALITITWIPAHIWYIAIYHVEDYRAAGVPMLPVVVGVERTAKIIVASVVVMLASELALFIVGPFSPAFLIISLPSTLLLLYRSILYAKNPVIEGAKRMYKTASPVEGMAFLGIAVDGLFRILL